MTGFSPEDTTTAQATTFAQPAGRPRVDRAEEIIQSTAKAATGVGVATSFFPMPVIDVAAVGGLQWYMVSRLAQLHGTTLKGNQGKAVVGAAVGALLPMRLGTGGLGYAVSSMPGGSLLSLATVPAFNYASTVAVGRVFHKHFASGGTLLDFKTDAMADGLMDEYRKAAAKYQSERARKELEKLSPEQRSAIKAEL